MKILHVINSLVRGGGAEALVLALATALNKIEGNVVHVLSLENPRIKNMPNYWKHKESDVLYYHIK